jgi:hypothetical protein
MVFPSVAFGINAWFISLTLWRGAGRAFFYSSPSAVVWRGGGGELLSLRVYRKKGFRTDHIAAGVSRNLLWGNRKDLKLG